MNSFEKPTGSRAKACHDLRNIAAAIEGGLLLLEREVRPTAEARETVDLLRRTLRELRETVSRLESKGLR